MTVPPFTSPKRSLHRPVLVREVLRELELRPGLIVVDGTLGAGGHSGEIWTRIQPGGRLLGLDRDPMMLDLAANNLAETGVERILSRYSELPAVLAERNVEKVDRVLLDLGLSSDQLADRQRGFGFDADGPFDLRFNPAEGRSAAELILASSVEQIVEILRDFGEEPQARRIAERLAALKRPELTARRVAESVAAAVGFGGRGKHPATRVFQAFRIAANQELGEVSRMLQEVLPQVVAPGGRVGIISFHSLEDRLVKQAFRDRNVWHDCTPKPIACSPAEERINPRARSAKLRVAMRNTP